MARIYLYTPSRKLGWSFERIRVPNWNRIVVGDAFRLPSRNFNYYRDLFLLCPFVVFSIAGIIHASAPDHPHRILGMKCLVLAALALALARERRILLMGALGFCAARFLFALVMTQGWKALVGLLVTGIPLVLSVRFLSDYKPRYEWPEGLTIAGLIVGLSSLIFTLAPFTWI
jgi:hypothetical protein